MKQYKEEIKQVLKQLKKEANLDYAFLTSIDIEEGKNFFVAADSQTAKLLSSAFEIKFNKNTTEKQGMLLRKEVMPKIKEELK